MKTIGFAFIYACSVLLAACVVAAGDGHWAAWTLGVFVGSAYYRFITEADEP